MTGFTSRPGLLEEYVETTGAVLPVEALRCWCHDSGR